MITNSFFDKRKKHTAYNRSSRAIIEMNEPSLVVYIYTILLSSNYQVWEMIKVLKKLEMRMIWLFLKYVRLLYSRKMSKKKK